MKALTVASFCLFSLLFTAPEALALTCPRRQTFDSKVSSHPVVLVGKIVRVAGKRYHVEVLKVLKGANNVGARKSLVFDLSRPRMSVGFGFAPKRGQLVLFFLDAGARDWTCTSPILLH